MYVIVTLRYNIHSSDVSTPIGNCINGSLRLEGGDNDTLGIVEICINNAWGAVCIDRFGTNEAEVICGQLGFLASGMFTPCHVSNPRSL